MRQWKYLFACGAQLQAWHLDRLAAHLWRRGLAGASAFDKQDPEVRNILVEIRLHQLVAEVMTAADPQETRELVADYLRETPAPIVMASAASVLMNVGQYAGAVQIYERLRHEVRSEPDYTRALLLAENLVGDRVAADDLLAARLDGNAPPGNLTDRLDTLIQRAALAETSGDADRACRLLLEARRIFPDSLAVLRPLAQTLERHQRFDDAAAIWREAVRHDRGTAAVEALASLELSRRNREAAFVLARDAHDPPTEAEQDSWLGRRVALYLATGHAKEAVDLARQRVRDGNIAGLVDAGSSLATHGQRQVASELFTDALKGTRDPLVRFQIQEAFIKHVYAAREVPLEDFLREMRRFEQCANAAPGQRDRYVEDRSAFAMARGETDWLEIELKREWNDGQGEITAGDRLFDLYLETKQSDALRALMEAVNARPNLLEQTLASMESRLLHAGHAAWALPISERLCRRFPLNADYSVMRAQVLWQAGQRDEAVRVLNLLDDACVFRDDFTGRAALVYLEMGDPSGAVASLERLIALDPLAVHSASPHCRLAALYLQDGRPDDAWRVLSVAYRNPTQADMTPLVDFLAATGRLEIDDVGELPGGDLPLSYLSRAQLLAAVYDRLHRSGGGEAAFRLVAAHPELLSPVPALVESLRRDATPEQIPVLTKLVEAAINQSETPAESLHGELAKLYVRRAEIASSAQPTLPGEALNFLTRAYELEPDDFSVVRPLALAFRQQHQDSRAKAILKPFLGADALPTENVIARQIVESKN